MASPSEGIKTALPFAPSDAPEVPAQAAVGEQKYLQDIHAGMSDAPPSLVTAASVAPGHQSIISREEKVEYRDGDGKLLNEEEVKALEGKVSFQTKYETRTRMVDANGNIMSVHGEEASVAPPHPDVQGANPETVGASAVDGQDQPASQEAVEADESKEESIAKSDNKKAKPASEGIEATA